MQRTTAGLAILTLTAGLVVGAGATAPGAGAQPTNGPAATPAGRAAPAVDQLPNSLADKQSALKQAALRSVLAGRATPEQRGASTVVRVGVPASSTTAQNRIAAKAPTKSEYVELSRQTTDRIFVILAEFGNTRDPKYPDQDTDPTTPGPAVFDGPLNNKIPQPNRAQDNSTIWQANYSQSHYQQLYFGAGAGAESLKTFYEKQSSGRYSVSGTVTNWVKVKYNEARYGRSNGYPCAGIVCSNTWALVTDALNKWVADQQAQGRSLSAIRTELKTFDKWDRYDYDGDGNFNEPDGYLDHFQIVHAGGDQADGDPQQGEDAIWSHRWYVDQASTGKTGPAGNLLGGTQVGNTGLWVGDYTIQPENGGLSVFAHEYGHDLGLPDLYDTAGGLSEPMEWWSLMAQSRLGGKGDEGIGQKPGDFDAWSKLFLGWLDYEVAVAGQTKNFQLGPHEYNSKDPQALVVVLPKKKVVTQLGAPSSGSKQWWSGQGDDLTATMSRQVPLKAGTSTLSFQARWNIEDCGPDACDYAYVEVDDGTGWKAIPGSITKAAEGNGIDGLQTSWKKATFDLSSYAGKTVGLRVRYTTDGAAQGTDANKPAGIFVDDITLTSGGSTLLQDGAETSPNGWTLDGFSSVGASATNKYDNYYIATWRTYTSWDRYLQYGPYNFGFLPAQPDRVEHFPYQQGLVVEYWNSQYTDNNVSVHPGAGLILVVDAHPAAIYRLDGTPWRTRIQIYDAPFSLTKADSFTLHYDGKASYIRGQAANPVFNDTLDYFHTEPADHGVKTAHAGVKLRVVSQDGTTARIAMSRAGTSG